LQILQYHVVPSAALKASQLQDDQQLTTALAGAPPLKVDIQDGKVKIIVQGVSNEEGGEDDSDVVQADIAVCNTVIHIVDEVLIPASLRTAASGGAESEGSSGGEVESEAVSSPSPSPCPSPSPSPSPAPSSCPTVASALAQTSSLSTLYKAVQVSTNLQAWVGHSQADCHAAEPCRCSNRQTAMMLSRTDAVMLYPSHQ
jgi:hypothetical protein